MSTSTIRVRADEVREGDVLSGWRVYHVETIIAITMIKDAGRSRDDVRVIRSDPGHEFTVMRQAAFYDQLNTK